MTTRARLDKVDELFRCPVVGLCLSCAEQRCLLKKLGVAPDGLSRYDMHERLVRALGGEEGVARPVLRLLETKYERRAAPLRALTEGDLIRAWQEAFAGGDCRTELWAAATRLLSGGARRVLYGRLRMALYGMVEERTRLRTELDNAGKKLRCKERRQAALDAAGAGPEERAAELERENARLRDEMAAAEALLTEQENALTQWRARVDELEQRLVRHQGRTSETWPAAGRAAPPCDTEHCNEHCPSFDLCRKRVLIVGGIERMETLYRKLVEERGGVFEYHAGHMRGGAGRLEKSLQRADVVLCPVNCNSHGACVLVKNLAKKYRKPVHMMPNFSLSAVAGVIGSHALVGGVGADGVQSLSRESSRHASRRSSTVSQV